MSRDYKGENAIHYAFQITRMVIFEVNYYYCGNNTQPYFSTSAFKFNQPKTDWSEGGQAQERLLPRLGWAYQFYKKWDVWHLKEIPKDKMEELAEDIVLLRHCYNSLRFFDRYGSGHIPFYLEKKLSMQDIKRDVVVMGVNDPLNDISWVETTKEH